MNQLKGKVPSLKELGPLCQKPNYKTVGNWYVRHILRDAALPVTWLLVHTEVSANQITLVSLIVGLLGIAFFAGLSPFYFLLGTALLQLWYFMDHVDGQIARYRKTSCLTGRFFDFMTHHIIHGAIFFGLAAYVFRATGSPFMLVWGYITSLSIMVFNLIHDTKYKTFFEALEKTGGRFNKELRQSLPEEKIRKSGLPHKIFSWIHKLCEIHVLMNLLTLAAILEWFFHLGINFRMFFFQAYSLIVPVLAVTKVSYLIQRRKIDEEYHALFHEV